MDVDKEEVSVTGGAPPVSGASLVGVHSTTGPGVVSDASLASSLDQKPSMDAINAPSRGPNSALTKWLMLSTNDAVAARGGSVAVSGPHPIDQWRHHDPPT